MDTNLKWSVYFSPIRGYFFAIINPAYSGCRIAVSRISNLYPHECAILSESEACARGESKDLLLLLFRAADHPDILE